MNNQKVISPITGSQNVILERTIDCQIIIDKYKKEPWGIETERFFHGLNKIEVYRCQDSGYRFHYPSEIAGDNDFYKELGKIPWYYSDWKWEHETTVKYINKGDKILEIGCGKGSFLKKLKENNHFVEGLEMNTDAVKKCVDNNLMVYSDSIEDFSNKRASFYDVVCSFQVLEHVVNVRDFIKSSITVLKPGGFMIVSVPNNDSSIFDFDNMALNMPPHHIGMWNTNSFIKLQDFFDFKIEAVHLEPFGKQHSYVIEALALRLNEKLRKKFGPFSPLARKIVSRPFLFGVQMVTKHLAGHTILAIFRKNKS